MMITGKNIAKIIKEELDSQGRDQGWLQNEMNKYLIVKNEKPISYNNLNKKLNGDGRFYADELSLIGKILKINLNTFKKLW